MNPFKSTLGKLGNLTKSFGKTAVDESKKTVQATVAQVGLPTIETTKEHKELPKNGHVPSSDMQKLVIQQDQQVKTDDNFVKDLYGAANGSLPLTPEQLAQQKTQTQVVDQQKMLQLRNQLHQSTYYQPLITRQKTQEEVERPAERVDRQKQEERWELQKKEEKKQPIAVGRAQNKTETHRGSSG